MCLIVGLHFLNILESSILIFLRDTTIRKMLFMIKRLIFYPNYLIALPDHCISLSYLCYNSLNLSTDRLFAPKLILIRRHNHLSIVLTLYDPFIILLFNLRKTFGAITLSVGTFSRKFLLRVGQSAISSLFPLHHKKWLILANGWCGHYSLAELAALKWVRLLARNNYCRFFIAVLMMSLVELTAASWILVFDLNCWGWHHRLVLDWNWVLSAKYKSPRFILFDCRRIHSWVRHSNLNCFSYCFIYSDIVTESLPLSVHWIYTSTWEHIAFLDESLPINLIFVLFARICTSDLENLDELSHSKSSALTLRSTMMMTVVAIMMMTVLFWTGLRSDWVMIVLVIFQRCIILDVS